MLISTIISSATSVIGAYLQNIASEKVVFWQYLLHALYFFFHNILPVCFTLYVMHVNGSSAKRSKNFYILFSFPFVICELLVLTNSFTGFVFYMDENFVYHRGSLITFNYIVGTAYFVSGFVFFFKYKRAISKYDSHVIGGLLTLSGIGVILQAVNSNIIVEVFAESLTIAGMMMMIEERSGYIDQTTGALNRVALVDNCRKLVETNQSFRIVLVKLTDIDLISKLFNNREIDSLLMQISGWLTSISSEEILYNYRSNDFAILYNGTDDKPAEDTAEEILERFGKEWKNGDAYFLLEVAVSIIRVPEDVSTLEEITEILASGYRKTNLGSRLVPYNELFANRRNRKIEQALRDAIKSKLLRVWYQPIWSVEEKRTVAAEALLRIDSDELRKISPEIYIPIAEQCGIIRDIGLLVFEDVCRFLKSVDYESMGIKYIEINLSLHQFIFDDLVESFEKIRNKYDIPVEAINLEITESASIKDTPMVEQTIKKMRDIGYSFSLDDFGTGYSNLIQFMNGSYKNVKIDKSLLWESDNNEKSACLLDNLIRIIRSLGYNVVQEGVETSEQLKRTETSGGNLIQGYYFSKPICEKDFISYLELENNRIKIPVNS